MSYTPTASRSIGVALLLIALASGRYTRAQGEEIKGDRRIDSLRFLATKNESNYRKIRTWSAEYRFIDRFPQLLDTTQESEPQNADSSDEVDKQSPSPPTIIQRRVVATREGLITFSLDVDTDRLLTKYQEDGAKARFLTMDDKQELVRPPEYTPFDQRVIITAERMTSLQAHLEYGPLQEFADDPMHFGGKSGRLAFRSSYDDMERHRDLKEKFDPRRMFSAGSPTFVGTQLQSYANALAGTEGEEARTRVDRLLELSKSTVNGSATFTMVMRYVSSGRPDDPNPAKLVAAFKESDGFLPSDVAYFDNPRSDIPHQHRRWVYEERDGIRIPREFHYRFSAEGTGDLVLDRHLILINASLNPALPEATFTDEGLGIQAGDRLLDQVEQQLYVSDGKSFVKIDQAKENTKSSQGYNRLLIGANMAVVVSMGGWVTLRWLRTALRKREGEIAQ